MTPSQGRHVVAGCLDEGKIPALLSSLPACSTAPTLVLCLQLQRIIHRGTGGLPQGPGLQFPAQGRPGV